MLEYRMTILKYPKSKLFSKKLINSDFCYRIYDPKIHSPPVKDYSVFGVKALKNLDNLKIC